ncbi:MAG: right-handed parallel beta-helix repeat-containing protein [Candidatus Heimdallarchaeota archaeon]|nr:right-handed parallel beta-helix repeat-containing protein [Candidatus Heimdallarchaeota archaeon]MCK5144086.1 right-handed parallel beta-helix repeat-containing protein [Candidatus Heimdallarchaeota archaeon]
MNKTKTMFSVYLVLSAIISTNIITLKQAYVYVSRNTKHPKPFQIEVALYTDPIVIANDTDFISYGFPGNGTSEDPYIIESFDIETTNLYGIYIHDTTKYFVLQNGYVDALRFGINLESIAKNTSVIRNCYFYDNEFNEEGSGICINNTEEIELDEITCYLNYNGISIVDSRSILINNSYCHENEYGIYCKNVTELIITNCESNDNEKASIFTGFVTNSSITNNYCQVNGYNGIECRIVYNLLIKNNTCLQASASGIRVSSEFLPKDTLIHSVSIVNNSCNNNVNGISAENEIDNLLIENNTCTSNSRSGIYVQSYGAVIRNNILTGNGIGLYPRDWRYSSVDEYLSLIVENNWVDGKLFNYIKQLNNTVVENIYGETIFIACNNLTIQDSLLEFIYEPFSLKFCYNVTLTNTTVQYIMNNHQRSGIHIEGSSLCRIESCKVKYAQTSGIVIYESNNCSIINSISTNNIFDGAHIIDSSYTLVQDSVFNNNSYGVASGNTISTIISNCTTSMNNRDGISSWYAFDFQIINSSICNNKEMGIEIWLSEDVIIAYNNISENEDYGIYFQSVWSYTYVHHNRFLNNNGGKVQAYDSGSNTWYDPLTKEGNHWSEHDTLSTYKIDGGKAKDKYPLDEFLERIGFTPLSIALGVTLVVALVSTLAWMSYPRIRKWLQK